MAKPIGDSAMSAAQRQQRRRHKLHAMRPAMLRVGVLLALDPESKRLADL